MLGLIMKVFTCPLIVYISDMIFNDIYYANAYQPVITGLIIAFAGHMLEVLFLKRDTLWINNILDLAAAFAIIYVNQFFFPRAVITVIGAAIAAFLIAVVEHFLHIYLIKEGKTRKE